MNETMTVEVSRKLRGRFQPRARRARLYVWFARNDDQPRPVASLLTERYANPVVAYRKALPAIYEAAGLPPTTKAAWSQTAGCACGCSPAFILDVEDRLDYFVTIGDGKA